MPFIRGQAAGLRLHKVTETETIGKVEILSSSSLVPHTFLLMSFTGSAGTVSLTESSVKADLAIYVYPCAWYSWTVLECSFNVKINWCSVLVQLRTVFTNYTYS